MTAHQPPLTPLPPVDGSQPCATLDPEEFFPPESQEDDRAAELAPVCGTCPFHAPCLEYAIDEQVLGVWAGTSTRTRRRLRRARRSQGRLVDQASRRRLRDQARVRTLTAVGLTTAEIAEVTGLHERTVARLKHAPT